MIEPSSSAPSDTAVVDGPEDLALRAGCHLYRSDDRDTDPMWRLAAPGDRFTTISGPDEVLACFADDPASAAREFPDAVRPLVDALRHQGFLRSARRQPALRVVLEGRNLLAEAVAYSLGETTSITPIPGDGGSTSPQLLDADSAMPNRYLPDVWITCVGVLRDSRFLQRERWCRERGISWHHLHVEGDSVLVGPLDDGRGAGYRDLRGRRLAASATPGELSRLWAHLDQAPEPRDWPAREVCAVAAGLLVADLHADTGGTIRYEHEVRVDDTGLRILHHPVLPLPETA